MTIKEAHNLVATRIDAGRCSYLSDSPYKGFSAFTYLRANSPTRPLMREAVKELIPFGFLDDGYTAKFNSCTGCRRCVPVRINLENFKSRRSARRLAKHNADLSVSVKEIDNDNLIDTLGPEQFDLFNHFHCRRFPGESLSRMDFNRFRDNFRTRDITIELRDPAQRLVAMTVLTKGPDYIYGVNYFYDTEVNNANRRLGRFAVLSTIEAFKDDPAIKYFYLGSWLNVATSGLQYKTDFAGIEIITDNGWEPYDPDKDYQTPDFKELLPDTVHWLEKKPRP